MIAAHAFTFAALSLAVASHPFPFHPESLQLTYSLFLVTFFLVLCFF